jgi:hypothetical protein
MKPLIQQQIHLIVAIVLLEHTESTPCEVAEEMLTMVSCEHQAASGLNLSAFDWAEHCLKQERKIKEDYNCAEYVWRQWTVR